tara:strand:+ start:602 stop:802 length:201 start_codon:yes stop_codon:yes gene_type:complete
MHIVFSWVSREVCRAPVPRARSGMTKKKELAHFADFVGFQRFPRLRLKSASGVAEIKRNGASYEAF